MKRRSSERLLDGVDLDVALRVAAGASLETSWIAWQQDLASDRSWMIATGTQALVAMLILVVVALGVRRILRRKRDDRGEVGGDGGGGRGLGRLIEGVDRVGPPSTGRVRAPTSTGRLSPTAP